MIAKFDSYRKFETPQLYVCNPGCLYSDGMLTNTTGILTDISDLEIIPTFNATSKLNFRCYKVRRDNAEENEHFYNLYNSIKNRKLIYADDIGFFVITDVEDNYKEDEAGGTYFKDVTAESCEVELRSKSLPYIEDGTYKFYTGEAGNLGIIEQIVRQMPLWTIGTIDYAVEQKYRTFTDLDFSKNVLGFMLEDLQDAYECIFIFDIINRIINVYDQANYVRETSIHITKDDFINSLNITESSDDLYTALSVTGDSDLSINAVNPLGTNVIYNFDYYLSWMTSGLRQKVSQWQDLVASYADEYYNLQMSRYSDLASLSDLTAERDRIGTQLSMYKRCKENIVAESSQQDIAEYNSVIASLGGIEIPEDQGYLWVMYADDSSGLHMSPDPYGKNYIGLSWDNATNVASVDPTDYQWFTYRSGASFPRTVDGATKYTWIVFADSIISGMSNDPDDKAYIGVSIDNSSSTKSNNYSDYSWSLVEKNGTGITQVLSTIISLADEAQGEYDDMADSITSINETIESKVVRISEINSAVSMQEYFTQEEMDELSNYIIEGSYTDEYVTVTDSMSSADIFEQMKTLYDRAVLQLNKISEPTQEFVLDVENFIFVKEFEQWSNELETGCLINVEVADNDIASLFLTSFEVNYEDKKLSMTFGNRYDRFDPKALFDKFLGDVSKTSNTLSYIKDAIYPIKNGEFNSMKEALETSRTLTKNEALSSTNEQVVIDDTGYTGRRKLPDGSIDPKQIKISGRNIVFTDDAWETCKTAIGEIILEDGDSAYGINAEIIMGNMIYGNELHILDSNGDDMFQVTENAILARVGDTYASKDEAISGVDVLYCRANSSTICNASTITSEWSTVAPSWVDGEYIWQKTVTTYNNGDTDSSAPTCITGATGATGAAGAPGNDGKGIVSTVIKYAVSSSGVDHPTSESDWSTAIPSHNNGEYLWSRTVITYTDNSTSTSYSVSRDGVNGEHTAVVYLYKRSTTAPVIDWNNSLTYNFSTHTLSSVPTDWSTSVPSGVNTLYMTSATASSNTGTDSISYTEWSQPIALTQNGINTATVFLYQRAANASVLTKPTARLTYTFATGTISGTLGGWSQTIPASDGNPCFVIQATASNVGVTDSIDNTEWSNITEFVSDGTDGVGISNTTVTYVVSSTGNTPPQSGWSASFPNTIQPGDYLWTRTITSYSDGNSSTVYSVSRNGAMGNNGRGISNVVNKYAVSTSSSVVPSAWRDDVPTLTSVNKYLWNYEIINYDDGTSSETEKRIIGVYGDQGLAGNGIDHITEYYLVSSSGTGVTTQTEGWTTTMQTVTADNNYLWNYETVTYTNGSSFESTPVIIGTFSNGITSSSVMYATSTSGTQAPSSGWQDSIPTISEGRYLWTRSITTYADGDTSTSYSVSRNAVNGNNTAIVYLYKRSQTSALVDWTVDLTYNFTNKSLTATPDGWYQQIPDGTYPIYMTAATATSSGQTDTIGYREFSTPVKIAQNGADGADGFNSATVFLYRRAANAESITKPNVTLTYTFATGTLSASSGTLSGWSQSIPSSDGNPCFIIQATAISTSGQDDILPAEWSDIRQLVADGEDGANGADGVGIASSSVVYAKSSSGATAPVTGWGTSIPADISQGEYLWTKSVLTYTNGESSTSYSVSRNAVNGTNGTNGADGKHSAVVYLYKRYSGNEVIPSPQSSNSDYYGENLTFDGTNYIDTGISLFSAENVHRDFEIAFRISECNWTTSQETIIASMHEVSPYPGFVIRKTSGSNILGIAGISEATASRISLDSFIDQNISFTRLNSHYYVRYGDNADRIEITPHIDGTPFNQNVTIGAALQSDGTAFRYWKGVLQYVCIRWLPLIDWDSDLAYNFTTNNLVTVPSGWSGIVPPGTDPLYVTAATVSSASNTGLIASTAWAKPVLLAQNGQNGANGLNSATVFLYQRSTNSSGLVKPSSTLTYTFSNGTLSGTLGNWTQSIPSSTGDPCYVIQATAVSSNDTDTILAAEWSDIHELVSDGADGEQGIGVESATVTYAVSTSGDVPPSEGWSDTFPGTVSEGNYLWTRTITVYTDGSDSIAYSVSASGVGIDSIVEEYYLSSSDTTQIDGSWADSTPAWIDGYYIWTRSHIYWSNGNETTTTPILNKALNELHSVLDTCTTDIELNKQGIQQNTEYYEQLNGQVKKINAYIQTGVLSYDDSGKATYGVKIGENLATVEAYIRSGSTVYTSDWLSTIDGGAALSPSESVIYIVKTNGSYYGKSYKWNGSAYEEASSDGTLSSIFTSSELGFYDTGEKTAYFSNKNLNVRTVRTNKILLSTDVISDTSTNNWQIGIDNGFYLKWIGA